MNKNLVIFIAASLSIFLGWQWWMNKQYPNMGAPKAKPLNESKLEKIDGVKPVAEAGSVKSVPAAAGVKAVDTKKSPAKDERVIVKTESIEVELSSLGAKVVSFKLLPYREHIKKSDPVQLVSMPEGQYGAFELSGGSLDSAAWALETKAPRLRSDGGSDVVFSTRISGTPMSLRKTFAFDSKGFVVRMRIEIMNGDKQAWKLPKSFFLWGPNVGAAASGQMEAANLGGAVQIEGKLTRMSLGDTEVTNHKAPKWVAVKNQYFVAAFINDGGLPEAELRGVELGGVTDTVTAALGLGELEIKAGETRKIEARLYAGPQEYSTLKSFNNNLNAVVQFTFQWLSPLSVFLLSVMQTLQGFTHNWGMAIIFLTILVKIALFYPTHKGMVASKRMQMQMAKMAPVLESLKKTYKSEPAKLQQETMRLYKEHGVNPLSGCILMFPQMFIMIALYGALNGAFELRGAAFFGPWIDLSAPDPSYILVPLMGASMWLQQKMTPVNTATMSEDQAQMQKMMTTMMPLMFTVMGFIFQWPTGLLLYWSVSNVFGIGQQWYVNKTVK